MGKKYLGINTYQAALQRLNFLYDEFLPEEIWLSLSGGKDSTVCYHLMKEVALSRDIKSINILIIDLEGHYKLHIDFLKRLIKDEDIEVRGYWVCLPFSLANALSFHMPKWLCWDKKKREKWVRGMPKNNLVVNQANNPFDGYFREGMEFEEFIITFPQYLIEKKGLSKVAQVIGIRTQESFNRYLKMKVKKWREFYKNKQWILKQKSTGYDTYSVHPIYDWDVKDVWKYLSGKDYTALYDKMYLAGYSLHKMRICQPYGAEQRDNIDLFARIEPETWGRMTKRVYGANFAKIYNGKNVLKGRIEKPDGVTWEGWARLILKTMPPFLRDHYLRRINVFLRWWRKEIYNDIDHVYSDEYADNESFDDEGIYKVNIYDEHEKDTTKEKPSWRRIAKVLLKGDYFCKNLSFQQNQKEHEKLEQLKNKYKDILL